MPIQPVFDPYSADRDRLARRRKMAEALMQQGMAPGAASETVSGIVVPTSPLTGLSKMAQVMAGKRNLDEANKEEVGVADRRRTDVARAMADFQGGVAPTPERLGETAGPSMEGPAMTAVMPSQPAPVHQRRAAIAQAMGSNFPELQRVAEMEAKALEHETASGSARLGADTSRSIADQSNTTQRLAQAMTERLGNQSHQGVLAGHTLQRDLGNQSDATTRAGQVSQAATAAAGHGVQRDLGTLQANTALAGQRSVAATAAAGQGVTAEGHRLALEAAKAKENKPTEAQIRDATGAASTRDAIGGYRDVLKNFDMASLANPAKLTEINSAYHNMLLQAKEAYRLGVLSKDDLRVMESVVTNPTSLRGVTSSRKTLDEQAQALDRIMAKVGERAGPAAQARVGGTSPGGAGTGATGSWQDALKQYGN